MSRFASSLCVFIVAGVGLAEEPLRLSAPADGVSRALFTPDGAGLVVVSHSGEVTVHDTWTGKVRYKFAAGKAGCDVIAPTLLSDGTTLALVLRPAGQRTGEIVVFDLATGRKTARWALEGEAAGSLAESPDGTLLAAACGRDVRVYELPSGKLRQVIPVKAGEETVFGGVRWTPDGKRLVFSLRGNVPPSELLVCDVESKAVKHRFPIAAVSYGDLPYIVSPDGSEVITFDPPDPVTALCKLAVWDLNTGKKLRTLCECGWQGAELALTPDGKRFVTCDAPGRRVVMGDVATGKVLATWKDWVGAGIALAPDGNSFASAGRSAGNGKPFKGVTRERIDHLK